MHGAPHHPEHGPRGRRDRSYCSAPRPRPPASAHRSTVSRRWSPDATSPTTFRVATFNVLGFGHTEPGGDRKGWANGRKRMLWATRVITASRVNLIGFQEFEPPQYASSPS